MKIQLEEPYPFIAPTPAAVVTVSSPESGDNLITIAWIGIACSDPPHISIAMRSERRHSYHILMENGEFAVNIASEGQVEAVDLCGTLHGDRIDKWKAAGLTREKASKISVPLIAEFPVNMECVLRHRLELGSHDLFIGEVLVTHIDSAIMRDGKIDIERFSPLAFVPLVHGYFPLRTETMLGEYGFTKK